MNITRRNLERRKRFNSAIATMFAGDENKAIRRALRICKNPDEVRAIPDLQLEKAESFINLIWTAAE